MVGAERPYSWFKHFHECGLYPVVITRHWNHKVVHINDSSRTDSSPLRIEKHEHGEIHYLPYKGTIRDKFISLFGNDRFTFIRKLLTFAELIAEFISIHFSAYKFLFTYAQEVIKSHQPAALIISANPFPQFRIGYLLKQQYGLKWLADYRDDWTTNQLNERRGIVKKLLLPVERHCEKKWVRSSAHFISVTPVYVRRIEQLTGVSGTNIYNGFEVEDLHHPKTKKPDEKFVLLYTGSVYAQQDFSMLAEGLKRIADENSFPAEKMEVCFLGATMNFLMPENVKQLSDKLNAFGASCTMLPHVKGEEFFNALRQCDMLFFTRYGNLQGIVPAKIFTYMGSLKPVLLAGSDADTIEHLIKPYSMGFIANDGNEVFNAVKSVLENPLRVASDDDRKYISQFSRKHLAHRVAEIVKQKVAV